MKISIFVDLLIVAMFAVYAFVALEYQSEGKDAARIVSGEVQLCLLAIGTLVAMPLAYAMPRLKADFLRRFLRVPSNTYVMSRPLVWLFITSGLGQVVGVAVFALSHDLRLLWLGVSMGSIWGAFLGGAWTRIRRPSGTEFAMPGWRWR